MVFDSVYSHFVKILLLSAYHAHSHAYWCDALIQGLPEFDWTVRTLPARYFSWRVRGNGLSWLNEPAMAQPHDAIVATSMVDLATVRGLFPALCDKPALLYFHENQFQYPSSQNQFNSLEPQLTSLYSALAANSIVFNSQFNRDTFLTGVKDLLRKFPDCVPRNVLSTLARRASVIPVPVKQAMGLEHKAEVFTVLWNHRWEYDKGPELLYEALERLPEGLPWRVNVVGQQFRQQPEVFSRLHQLLTTRGWLGAWGYETSMNKYEQLLGAAHVVVSTAAHDFQGIAILEAVAAGCIPVVPKRLAYLELFPEAFQYYGTDEASALSAMLTKRYDQWQQQRLPKAPSVDQCAWANVRPLYERAFKALVEKIPPT